MNQLDDRELKRRSRQIPNQISGHRSRATFVIQPDALLKISRLMQRLNTSLDLDTILIADVGDALFAALELVTHDRGEFLSPAYCTSMGFSVPAAAARPDHRIVVLVVDGVFQMTGCELSTLVRHNCSPIVIVLDNHGYGTERYLQEGNWEYNEILSWAYHRIPELLGGGKGFLVETKLNSMPRCQPSGTTEANLPSFSSACCERGSETLRRLGKRRGDKVSGK